MGEMSRAEVGDNGTRQLIDRFRVVLSRVQGVVMTRRFGIPQSTVYRFRTRDYYPTKRLDPEVEGRLREAVETLEDELGISHDVLRGTVREPRPGYAGNGGEERIESDLQVQIEAVIRNPDLIRRVLGTIPPEDVNTRLAIWRAYEDDFVEAGIIPIPDFMEAIRREIYERAPVDFRADSP